jgi:hypothetical protein
LPDQSSITKEFPPGHSFSGSALQEAAKQVVRQGKRVANAGQRPTRYGTNVSQYGVTFFRRDGVLRNPLVGKSRLVEQWDVARWSFCSGAAIIFREEVHF